jgi:hypothetical protein
VGGNSLRTSSTLETPLHPSDVKYPSADSQHLSTPNPRINLKHTQAAIVRTNEDLAPEDDS